VDLRQVTRVRDRDHLQPPGPRRELRHGHAGEQKQERGGGVRGAADREPATATTTTTTTSSRATFVFDQVDRNGSRIAATASGATSAARIARRSLVRYRAITEVRG
jgi:hypothetical protein